VRRKIPSKIAAEIEFLSNRTCCVCREKNKPYHIHHIDNNPRNNKLENLAILCIDPCHNQASLKGGLGRKLSSEAIRTYRKDWLEIIFQQRKSNRPIILDDNSSKKDGRPSKTEELIEALTIVEVRKLGYKIEVSDDWIEIGKLLKLLSEFAMYERSDLVRSEIQSSVHLLIYKFRFKSKCRVTEDIPHLLDNIILESMPIHTLVSKDFRKLNEEQRRLIRFGGQLGFESACFGIKHLRNIALVKSGSSILWSILRYSILNDLVDIKKETEQHFDSLLEVTQWAPGGKFTEAIEELEFQRNDAKDLHGL
jgi:hypothetical protein